MSDKSRMSSSAHRFLALDALRGIAAFVVVFLHIYAITGPNFTQKFGYLAVDLFFLLSGFVLSHSYDRRFEEGLSPKKFLFRRISRLYPLYIIGIALGILATAYSISFSPSHISSARFLFSIAFSVFILPFPALGMGGHAFVLNFPSWSLFYEIFANAVFGFLWKFLSNTVLCILFTFSALILLATSLHFGSIDFGSLMSSFSGGIPRVCFGFFLGVLLARTANHHKKMMFLFAFIAFLLGVLPIFYKIPSGLVELYFIFVIFPFMIILLSRVILSGTLAAIAAFVGSLSFPIYVVHAPLREAFTSYMRLERIEPGYFIGVIFLLTCTFLAFFVQSFIEPSVRRFLNKKVLARNSPDRDMASR